MNRSPRYEPTLDASTILQALQARRSGAQWVARCPAHQDRIPSLSIRQQRDGRLLLFCHAGCSQERVLTALRRLGLWGQSTYRHDRRNLTLVHSAGPGEATPWTQEKAAARIWAETIPCDGTVAEAYLRSRAITLRPPSSLRFHTALRHPSGGLWPALVAHVSHGLGDKVTAVHRTYLARDGSGKAAITPCRMMLGTCRGGAVHLGLVAPKMLIGEGIETCLSAGQETGTPTLAALSATNLAAVNLPEEVREIVILADGDDPGEQAATMAARRWCKLGLKVRIARPPRGRDFNDLLRSKGSSSEGSP